MSYVRPFLGMCILWATTTGAAHSQQASELDALKMYSAAQISSCAPIPVGQQFLEGGTDLEKQILQFEDWQRIGLLRINFVGTPGGPFSSLAFKLNYPNLRNGDLVPLNSELVGQLKPEHGLGKSSTPAPCYEISAIDQLKLVTLDSLKRQGADGITVQLRVAQFSGEKKMKGIENALFWASCGSPNQAWGAMNIQIRARVLFKFDDFKKAWLPIAEDLGLLSHVYCTENIPRVLSKL